MNKATFMVTIEGDGEITKGMLEPLAEQIKTTLVYQAEGPGLVSLAAEAAYGTDEQRDLPEGIAFLTNRVEVKVAP
jgi:hypothetical protein